MRAALLLLPLSLFAACLRQTEFQCATNDQCNPGGTCQTVGSSGYCSFSDSGCASGQRFGDSAGPYANQCVGEQSGGTDGGIVDSMPPDDAPAATCPAEYMALAGGTTGHFYRKAPGDLDWVAQFDFCMGTSTRAYLAVPDDAAELTALAGLAGTTPFWVGINDRATEGSYVKASGGPATFLPWAAGEPDSANQGPDASQDCVSATATNISDQNCTGGGASLPAVCECAP